MWCRPSSSACNVRRQSNQRPARISTDNWLENQTLQARRSTETKKGLQKMYNIYPPRPITTSTIDSAKSRLKPIADSNFSLIPHFQSKHFVLMVSTLSEARPTNSQDLGEGLPAAEISKRDCHRVVLPGCGAPALVSAETSRNNYRHGRGVCAIV